MNIFQITCIIVSFIGVLILRKNNFILKSTFWKNVWLFMCGYAAFWIFVNIYMNDFSSSVYFTVMLIFNAYLWWKSGGGDDSKKFLSRISATIQRSGSRLKVVPV